MAVSSIDKQLMILESIDPALMERRAFVCRD